MSKATEQIGNGRIQLVDPNLINVNNNLEHPIPNYEEMFIYVELNGIRRGRSVIETTSAGQAIFANTIENKDVSFMGFDNQNSNTFTTSWYEDDREEGQSTSGFGIKSINVKVDSSYIPKVNIKFIDIRGIEFFNKVNSPFRMLFDFPPPIFELKIKGYYGKTVKYLLHLVSYTTEFDDATGNYEIDGAFVALTFAPLSDIPFKYILQFSLLENYDFESFNINPNSPPRNTFELVHKVKNVYSNLIENINKTNTAKEYELSEKKLENVNIAIDVLRYLKDNETLNEGGKPTFILLSKNNENHFVEEYVSSIDSYNMNSNKRIFVGYINDANYQIPDKYLKTVDFNVTNENTEQSKQFISFLKVIPEIKNSINNIEWGSKLNENDIQLKEYIIDKDGKEVIHYICDITEAIIKLSNVKLTLEKNRIDIGEKLKKEINDTVVARLGMLPTIKNIFELILNDVDTFFRILTKVSINAENSHSKHVNKLRNYINEILDDNSGNTLNKIYAFPLIINERKRSSPNLLKNILYEMPELVLVNNFIESFKYVKSLEDIFNLTGSINDNNEHLWIPLSAHDSNLGTGENPYFTFNNNSDIILGELINRFYVLFDIILHDDLYNNDSLIRFYAESEAINIVNSLSTANVKNIDNFMTTHVNKYKNNNIQSFYDYIKEKHPNKYSLSEENKITLPIKGFNSNLSINKSNENFIGFIIDDNIPQTRNYEEGNSDDTARLINSFLKELKNETGKYVKVKSFFKKIIGNNDRNFEFTKNNLIFLDDETYNTKLDYIDVSKFYIPTSIFSSYIIKDGLYIYESYLNEKYINKNINKTTDDVLLNGNRSLNKYIDTNLGRKNKGSGSLYYNWIITLLRKSNNDIAYDIYKNITDSDLVSLLSLSGFGSITSPYNIYPNQINNFMSQYPMGVVIPQNVIFYMGGLVYLIDNNKENVLIDFIKTNNEFIYDGGLRMLADLSDIKNFLSETDKKTLLNEYEFYRNNYMSEINKIYYELIENVKEGYTLFVDGNYIRDFNINDIVNVMRENTILNDVLLKRRTLYLTSNLTFKFQKSTTNIINDLELIETQPDKKSKADNFFSLLFTNLEKYIKIKKTDINETNRSTSKLKYDSELVDETYYSLKNINDKWIAGTKHNSSNNGSIGYPFSPTGKLIDLFSFVDRTMNTIDDTIINPEILIDLADDNSISVFTVISQILSLNNFEFFPLQNFMNFEQTSTSDNKNDSSAEWENAFKIDTSGEITATPAFICMYIGGGSSYPTNISDGNLFKDDGILKFGEGDDLDFNVSSPNQYTKDYLGKVKSFKVRFGEQNQSMFTGFKIDSKEYAETNESLQILSRIAGDQNQEAQIPLSQSLFNVYRDRSYKATINGLGNATIQPTQYFQLEGVTIFNGVYMILDVEHTIEKNYFTTNFSGLKVLKYPVPRMTNVASTVGYNLGESELNKTDNSTNNNIITRSGDANNVSSVNKINSLFTFKVNTTNKLTQEAKNYILNYQNPNDINLISGKHSHPLPFSKGYNGTFTSKIIEQYPNNRAWLEYLIVLLEKYAHEFDLDPNMLAAQIETESSYKLWTYSNDKINSSAGGLTQFTMTTFYNVVIKNAYNTFTSDEIFKITGNEFTTYNHFLPNTNRDTLASRSRPEIYQRMIDNPEIMIKAQCSELKNLSKIGNGIMASTLMGYHGGSTYTKSSFEESLYTEDINNQGGAHSQYARKIMGRLEKNYGYYGLMDKNFDVLAANAANPANNLT